MQRHLKGILTVVIIIILAGIPAPSVSANILDVETPAAAILDKNEQTQASSTNPSSAEFVGENPEDEAVRILSSTVDGITFEIVVPWEELVQETTSADGREYTRITMDDWPLDSVPGAPVLPFLNEQLGIPFDAEITLSVLPGAVRTVSLSHPVLPGQTQRINWVLPTNRSSPGLPEPVFTVEENSSIYTSDVSYPGDLVRVSSDGVLRQQRVLGLNIYPVQFHPGKQELTIYETLQVEVIYGGAKRVPTRGLTADSEAYEGVLKSGLLNYEIAEQFRQAEETPALKTMSFAEGATLPSAPPEPGWRIRVREDGIYRLTYDELFNAGVLDGSPDPKTFKIFNQGSEIAIQVFGEEDGTFDSGDMILFYGQKNATKYTLDNVYWLTYDPSGAALGSRVPFVDGTPGALEPPATFHVQQHNERNGWYLSQIPGDETVDRWVYDTYIYATGDPKYDIVEWVELFTLPGSFAGSASLRLSMIGFQDYAGVIDHHVKVFLNNIEVSDEVWDGFDTHTVDVPVSEGILNAGNNTLKVAWVKDTGLSSETVYFDWYELDYQSEFTAQNNSLSFTYSEPGSHDYLVQGFTTDQLRVFNITNPTMVEELGGSVLPDKSAFLLKFQDEVTGPTQYRIIPDGQFSTVQAVEADTPSNLRSITNAADYIVITHANFMEQAERLADYRAGRLAEQVPENVLNTMVVDVQDIYDEFNFGITGAAPLKDFLAYAYTSWKGQPTAPSYVVLMGDGNFDPNNYWNNGRVSYIPPYLAPVDPWIKETAADNQYVAITGEDNIPDMMLGRMVVNTVSEADIIVNKVIAYEQTPTAGDWQQQILSVADNADVAGNFSNISDRLIACCQPAPYTTDKVYLGVAPNTTASAASAAILSSINNGKLFINYNGHGSFTTWADETLFKTTSVTSLTNGSMLPVIISMACFDGYYHNPDLYTTIPGQYDYESLAEVMTRADGKGALASWSATGLGVASGHDHLSRGFYSALFFNGASTLGQATTAGKLRLWSTGGNLDLLDTYLLFGDPAQVIPITELMSISGRVLDDQNNPLSGVAVWDNTGHNAKTDLDGYYTLTGTPVGGFTITPYKSGYAFVPETRSGTLSDADITGMDFTGTLVPIFTISGYVRSAGDVPIKGVLITDDKGHSTYTNVQGYYKIPGLILGNYMLSAVKEHYLIKPLQQTVKIIDSDLTLVNFTVDPLYTISGTITDGAGSSISNVSVSNGQGLTTHTDSAGAYSFTDLTAGSYNIIPSRIGFLFEPASTGVEVTNSDASGINFTGSLDPIFSISGTISEGVVGLSGVTVSDGAGHSTVTDDAGSYTFANLTLGSYTLTPSKTDYSFDPVTRSSEIVNASLSGVDFSVRPVFTISGTVRDAFDVPVEGVTITDNLLGSTAVTNAAGAFTLTTLPAGSYTLSATKTGEAFSPASPGLNIVTVGPSATGIDFIKNNLVPGVTATSPAYAGLGDVPFTLTITGQDFVQGAVVRWNAADRITTFIDSRHLSINLMQADLSTAGTNTLTVFNPLPGGGESISTIAFPVIAHTPAAGEFMLTNKVTFDWDDLTAATLFNVQLSLSPTFNGVMFSVNTASSNYTYGGTLLNARTYYWRIRPQINGLWGEWSQTWQFNSQIQSAPAYDAITSDATPFFSWFGYPGAIGYMLEIIPESYPGNPATSALSISLPAVTNYTIPNVSALDHGRYLWRLQVFTATSTLLTPYRRLSITPPPPALISPTNNAFSTTRTPVLSWTPVAGVTGYKLIVDNNSDFRTPEYPEILLPSTDSTHTLLSNLPADTRYYWRMRSTNLVGDGPWSPTYSFIVDTFQPAKPVLNAPANNAFTPDTTPTLSVFAAAGANRYNFQLASSADFLSPLFDQTLSTTSFTVPNADALPYAWRYYWRARSLDAAGNVSDWSEPRAFTLTIQSSPAFDAVTPDTTPTFTWYGVPGASGYLLEIIPEDNPATLSHYIPLPVVTNFTLPNISALNPERYLWRLHVYTASSTLQTPYRRLSITPPPPALLNPANNTFVTTRTPELSWSSIPGAINYKLIIDNNSDFRTPEYPEISLPGTDSTHTLAFSLPADTRYYWRMSSIDAQGNPGPWSGTRSFVVDTIAPPNPALYLPVDNAAVSGTPTYSWRAAVGAGAYEFQYSTAPDFGTISYSSGVLTTLNHRPPTQEPGAYYWRVLSRDAAGNWSSGSTSRTLTVNLPVPAAPVLASPANNLFTNPPPVLTWNAVPYGSTYEVQLSTSIYFTPASLLPVTDPVPSDVSLTLDPLVEGRYYWRTRAVNANAIAGLWSGYRSFVIDTTAPPNPALYLPVDNASVSGTPTYSWRAAAGATAYEFQYSTAPDFGSISYSSGVLTTLNHRPPTQEPGTYYWRVLARDAAGNWSTGSTSRSTTINLPAPAAPVLAAPINNLFTNPPPVLTWNAVPYGSTYEVQLSTNTTFTALLPVSDPTPGDLLFTPDLLPEGRYYWRTRAVNANSIAGLWTVYRSFVIDTTAQAVPSLNAPAINAFTSDTTPSLSVIGVAGANRYTFQLSASSDFSSPLFDQTLFTTTFTVPNAGALPYAEGYFWRARSLDAAGNASSWSEPRTFIITFQNAPAVNALTSDTTPSFTWYGVPGALGYRLEVIPAPVPGNPTTDSFAIFLPVITGYTIPNISTLDHGSYLWQMKAFTVSGTLESPWRPLRITAPPPALLSPVNNAFISSRAPILSWIPVTGAARYEVWVDDSSLFNSLDYQNTTITGAESTHTLLSTLPFDRRYYWRMRTIDFLDAAGPWSAAYSFIVDTINPAVPVLNTPANNAFTPDTTPSLSVFAVAGANRYNFQLSASSDFSAPLFDQTLFSTTFTVPNADALSYSEGYFWRARSLDTAGNTSAWSTPRSFTITFQNAPAYNAATTDTTPTFTWYGVPGALGYRLEVIPAPTSGNPTTDTFAVSLSTVTAYTVPNISALDYGWYQWRVRVYTLTGSQYTPWRPLTVTPVPLAAPVLSSPSNVVINNSSPQFSWLPVINAAGYEIMVDNSLYFNSPEYTITGIAGSDTIHTATGTLINGVYYWRMRTINDLGVPGSWSAYRTFRITL